MSSNSNPSNEPQASSPVAWLYTLPPILKVWRQRLATQPAYVAFYGLIAFVFRLVMLLGLNEVCQFLGKMFWHKVLDIPIERQQAVVQWLGNMSVILALGGLLYCAYTYFFSLYAHRKGDYQLKTKAQSLYKYVSVSWGGVIAGLVLVGLIAFLLQDQTLTASGVRETGYYALEYALPAGAGY